MEQVGIVVLNYETYKETINCVDSIKRHRLEYKYIVIVDNASENESYSILSKKYRDDDKVYIIKTNVNLGFAKGNNVGIQYLKQLGIRYILLLNSDTVVLRDDYLVKMINACSEGVGIVGSNIKLMNGREQGGEIEDLSLLFSIYGFLKSVCRQYYIYFPFRYNKKRLENLRVHGCAILLTPDFFKKYECLWPYTFLYREEMILSIVAKKAKLKTVIADTWIYHKESQTTGKYWTNYSRKRKQLEMKSYLQQVIVNILPYGCIKETIRRYINNDKKCKKKHNFFYNGNLV